MPFCADVRQCWLVFMKPLLSRNAIDRDRIGTKLHWNRSRCHVERRDDTGARALGWSKLFSALKSALSKVVTFAVPEGF